MPFGRYKGTHLGILPDIYRRDLREQLRLDGTWPEVLAALDEFMEEAGAEDLYVTIHAVNRWSARVLGLGALADELKAQAWRAWDEGAVLPPKQGAERRQWRDLVWVFARRRGTLSLLTVMVAGEEEEVRSARQTERLDLS
jgi:hypothetical protein